MRLSVWILCVICTFFSGAYAVCAESESERQSVVETWDRMDLRHQTGVVTDSSRDLLRIPDRYGKSGDFTMAHEVPVIDFAPVRGLYPEFFPEDNKGMWSQWGEVTKGPNGRFYMASGDHRCKDGHVYITEYDPVACEQKIVVNVGKVCGWTPGEYVDGKIHGRMDVLPDGTLVAATWLGSPIKDEWRDHGYVNGGRLMTYNVNTGMTEYHGIPFLGDSWPYYSVDIETGIMTAIGAYQHFMSYDVINQKLLYGGCLPQGMIWNSRGMLLDERTGKVYSTDTPKDHNFNATGDTYRFICFDPMTNEFEKLECAVPVNPVTGLSSSLRAYSAHPMPGGFFWCLDYQGTLFKFYPEEDRTELVGVNWDESGVYTATIAMSPRNRYMYYMPGSSSGSVEWGHPVVQYDTRTGEKKVLAFLNEYYHEKYGYLIGGSFGIELSEEGSLLVIQTNGEFGPRDKSAIGQPAMFAIHIPAKEREE